MSESSQAGRQAGGPQSGLQARAEKDSAGPSSPGLGNHISQEGRRTLVRGEGCPQYQKGFQVQPPGLAQTGACAAPAPRAACYSST